MRHSSYGRLRKLKGLNDLRGEMCIKNLEKVGADDAAALESKEAILKKKQHLQSLELEWGYEWEYLESDYTTTAELVLEGLEPHPNLKELKINRYCGERFPSWMIKMGNVVNISLWHCHRCQLLQPLDQLPCLKFLDCYDLKSLEYIQYIQEEEEDYDNNKKKNNNQVRDGHPPPSSSSSSTLLLLFFPSLQELLLRDLPELKCWWKRRRESVSSSSTIGEEEEEEEEEKYTPSSSSLVFSQLTKLNIKDCPMFTSMPLHPNIENLRLNGVSEKLVRERLTSTSAEEEEERKVCYHHQMLSSSNISSISKLNSLYIGYIEDLEVLLPEFLSKNLNSLESLKIEYCNRLLCLTSSSSSSGEGEGEGFRYLTSLRILEISNCAKLKSIFREIQHLTALEDIRIEDCPELELSDAGMHWQCLRSLCTLEIKRIPKLVTLPVGIQHLTTLQHLTIHACDEFLAVPDWIGNLTQLQQLRFSDCPKLASLPQEIRCLTSLQQLQIVYCPKLSERCQNETGEDWLNIAHIPTIKIDFHIIQGTNFYL